MAGENASDWTKLYVTSGVADLGNISFEIKGVREKRMTNFIPKQIIQREDSKTTILIWEDNSKTIVQCSPDEEFVPEFGVAMATMNKIYGNRTQFKKHLDKNTFWQDRQKKREEVSPFFPMDVSKFNDKPTTEHVAAMIRKIGSL